MAPSDTYKIKFQSWVIFHGSSQLKYCYNSLQSTTESRKRDKGHCCRHSCLPLPLPHFVLDIYSNISLSFHTIQANGVQLSGKHCARVCDMRFDFNHLEVGSHYTIISRWINDVGVQKSDTANCL